MHTLFNYVLQCFCFVLSGVPTAINVIVQLHNGGFLPDVILFTQCYYHRGTRLNVIKRFCLCSLRSNLNVLAFSPLTGECSEGLDAFIIFFKRQQNHNPFFVECR